MVSTSSSTGDRVHEHIARHVLTADPRTTVGQVRATMVGRDYDCADSVVVVDGNERVLDQVAAALLS